MGSSSSLPLDPIENEWIINWLTSPIYTYFSLALSGIQSIFMSFLFIMYVYKLHVTNSWMAYNKNEEDSVSFINNSIHVITLISITFSFISGVITFINNDAKITSDTTCIPITITLNICWIVTKVSIYNVTLLRLQAAFWNTMFEYKSRFMYFLYIIINSIFVISIICTIFDVDSIHFAEPGQPGWCLYIIPTYLIFLPTSLDIFFTPIAVILFIKPLHMLVLSSSDEKTKKNGNIEKLLTKYVLLSSIGTFSNVFSSFFFAITDITAFNDIDIFINPLCLVLMQTYSWNIYYFVCKFCHDALSKCLYKHRQNIIKDIKMIEMDSNSNINSVSSSSSSGPAANNKKIQSVDFTETNAESTKDTTTAC